MATKNTYSGASIILNRLNGAGVNPVYLGVGTGTVTGSANSNVNMFAPSTQARATATVSFGTTNYLADTIKYVGTITATETITLTEAALFDSSALSPTTTVTDALSSTATGTTLVASTTGFPSTGNFYCQLDNETVVATVVDSTHLDIVSRGALGSTAAAHSAGSVITAGGDGGASGLAGATSAQTSSMPIGGSCFVHADYAQNGLNANDSIQYTFATNLTP